MSIQLLHIPVQKMMKSENTKITVDKKKMRNKTQKNLTT